MGLVSAVGAALASPVVTLVAGAVILVAVVGLVALNIAETNQRSNTYDLTAESYAVVEEQYITTSNQQLATTTEAKTKGKERMRDSGLTDVSDAEVQQRARDKSLPKSEQQRYKTEEKARGLRNKTKRDELY